MGYQLRPGLHFCETNCGFIFLDLRKDRYFRLSPRLEQQFHALTHNPLAAGAAAAPLLEAGILCKSTFRQAIARPSIMPPSFDPRSLGHKSSSASEISRAVASDFFLSRQLRWGRLHILLASYMSGKAGRALTASLDDDGVGRVIRGYELAKLIRSPANRCLSRSLAMARRLASVGCDAMLVIGVRAQPFTAHAWVQSEGVVLNDTPDEVSRYTPILVA